MLMQALMLQLWRYSRYYRQKLNTSTALLASSFCATALLLTGCSNSGAGTSDGGTILNAPSAITVEFIDTSTLAISWNSASGASEYHLFRDENSDGSLRSRISRVTATSHTDTDLDASKDYWYWLRSCTSSSNCSDFSEAVGGSTTPASLDPGDFSATSGAKSITLSWTENSSYSYHLLRATNDCLNSVATDFNNYQALCANDEYLFDTEVSSPVEHNNLDHESTYYYWLEISDSFGNKSYTEASATPSENTDSLSGDIMWQEALGSGVISLAPALDSERRALYVAVDDELYALNIDSGEQIWDSPFTVESYISADPIIDKDGSIYITATSSAASSSDESVVYRINPDTGTQTWISSGAINSVEDVVLGGAALVQSEASDSFYFANSEGDIYVIDNLSTGTAQRYASLIDGAVSEPISVDIYGNLYTGTDNGDLLIATSENNIISTDVGNDIVGSIVLNQSGEAFFGAGQRAYSYDSQAIQRWRSSSSLGTRIVTASAVLAPDNASIYIPGYSSLHAIDANSGINIWSYDLSDSTIGSTAPVVDSNGYVYLGDSEGDIYVVSAQGELVNQYSSGRSSAISTPIALDDTASILYFGAGQWLYAIQAHGSLNQGSHWAKYRGNVRNTGYVSDSISIGSDVIYAQQELDNTDLVFTGTWVSETTDSFTGGSSMRSPENLQDTEVACISTQLQQAGNLSFYWKVSSEELFDFLTLTITKDRESTKITSISGEQGWNSYGSILVDADSSVQWCYNKDHDISEGSDAAWLDYVTFDAL